MYAAVSGLRAHMSALNVIGENISNVNTTGYKAARYTFNEALYTTSRSGSNGSTQQGGVNPAQIGYGSSIGTIDLDMSTKIFTPTGLNMDCMIDGDGMFILGDKSKSAGIKTLSELQGMNLSRLGNFGFDAEGWLTDGDGSVVYGFLCTDYNVDTGEYVYSPTLTAIRVPNCINVLQTRVDDNGKETKYVETTVFNPYVSDGTDGVSELGDTMDGTNPYKLDPADATGKTILDCPEYPYDYAAGQAHTDLATLKTDYDTVYGAGATAGATPGPTVQANADKYKSLLDHANATTERVSLSSCSIDKTGRIVGITQDDQQVVVGMVALAKVDNPNGLTHTDGRYYKAMGGAGDVHLCSVGGTISYVPNRVNGEVQRVQIGVDANNQPVYASNDVSELTVENSGDTELVNGGLEGSGTDLATEISNMIMIQRGYQANTRIVTVTDSMLEELVNMKR